MKKNLPIYEAKIDMNDATVGMFVISLVDYPAVEKDFFAFSNKKTLQYKVVDEEQQKVFGVVMTADQPIYRMDEDGYEYYITYSPKTISLMTEKYFKYGYHNNVDTNHNFKLENGITLTQMFIKDTEKGVNPSGFDDVKDGSLFAEFHIENEQIWKDIKEGKYKGFSLAGTFNVEEKVEDEDEKIYDEIIEMLDRIIKKRK